VTKAYRGRRFLALLRYWLRTIWRRSAVLSWVVLVVALYIALAVVVPPLQNPLRSIGLEFPALAHYQVSGTIRRVGTDKPVSGVRVSVGGYSATTNTSGHYVFSFSASSSQQIAVVIDTAGVSEVYFENAGPDDKISLDEYVK
jgi:hypothetical protein